MDWSLQQILDEIVTRVVSGPFQFRLIMQPTMAICLGIRDGFTDAKTGAPPYLWALFARTIDRRKALKALLLRLRVPVIIASVFDAVVQYIMFGHVRPLTAILVGSTLMAFPYSAARGLSNRMRSRRLTPPRRSRAATRGAP